MDDEQLVRRAIRGEIIGDGRETIRALVEALAIAEAELSLRPKMVVLERVAGSYFRDKPISSIRVGVESAIIRLEMDQGTFEFEGVLKETPTEACETELVHDASGSATIVVLSLKKKDG